MPCFKNNHDPYAPLFHAKTKSDLVLMMRIVGYQGFQALQVIPQSPVDCYLLKLENCSRLN